MRHVYLSPHLDDAVLSCGGAIHRHRAAGMAVAVLSVFAEDPPDGVALSPFALLQHSYWGNPPRPMALRRAEDAAALALLDCEAHYLEYRDAVYRAGADGRWLYTDLKSLMGPAAEDDAVGQDGARGLALRLGELLPPPGETLVYAPLGIGRHVDHLVVHAAARRLEEAGYRLALYEDYPYAEKAEAVGPALAAAGGEGWAVEVVELGAADVAAKVSATGYYASQLAVLFGGADRMPNRTWTFATTRPGATGPAERIWWPR